MKILLLSHSFNSLTQRCFVELREAGHDVSVEFDINAELTAEAVEAFRPELVIAPFLKRMIPEQVWRKTTCLIVHPGIPGDGGPTALDWAILNGEVEWGVTVLEADGDFDQGPIWAAEAFAMREATKASLYRNEVSDAAMACIHRCVVHFGRHGGRPAEILGHPPARLGRWRDSVPQKARSIDFPTMESAGILGLIRASDGVPGARATFDGVEFRLFDARMATGLRGKPGEVVCISGGDVAVATVDGALWIGHAKRMGPGQIKLPAAQVLPIAPSVLQLDAGDARAPCRVWVDWHGSVAVLHFEFYNGAMGVAECKELLAAYLDVVQKRPRIVILAGGPDYWSNGMDLNRIEAAASPADESWANINAIDDLAEAIIRTADVLTISAIAGNAGAGGVFLARAADLLWLRDGVTLNPHYKDMGNLHGSEFWSYLLPRHCGQENADAIMKGRLPMGASEALRLGLSDRIFDRQHFWAEVLACAEELSRDSHYFPALQKKHEARARDEARKPLASYRSGELAMMRRCFYGSDPSYHVARHNFVHKVPKSRTPLTIAQHRRTVTQVKSKVLA